MPNVYGYRREVGEVSGYNGMSEVFAKLISLCFLFLCVVYSEALLSIGQMTSAKKDAAMFNEYSKLCRDLIDAHYSPSGGSQKWIAVAGGPGSGKSTLTAAVVQMVNDECRKKGADKDACVCLPMDGFHFSRAELQKIAEKNPSVTFEQLIARRGAPWTFNVDGLVSSLQVAKEKGEGLLPTYSRQKSDPVWEPAIQLQQHHQIVLVEGNYLLNWDTSLGANFKGQEEGRCLQAAATWGSLEPLFDETWFIRCESLEKQRQRLIFRHLETWTEEKTRLFGEGEAGAAKKADTNDVLNAAFVAMHAKFASREIVSVG